MSRFPPADLALAGVVAVSVLVLHGPLLRLGLTLGDDGYLAYGVERILEGQVIYRDFDRNYPPGIYYTYALVFRLFGCEFTHTRVGALLMLAALAAGSYLLSRPFAPRWAALLAGAFPVFFPPPWHKAFVPLAIVVGLAICRGLASHPDWRPRLFWAGVGTGCIALFRQDVAVFSLLIAGGTVSIREVVGAEGPIPGRRAASSISRRVALAWAKLGAGAALVWSPVLLCLAMSRALTTALEQIILGGYRTNLGLSLPFPGPFDGLTASEPTLLALWLELPGTLFYFPGAAALGGLVLALNAARRSRFELRHAVLCQWSLMAVLTHALILQRSDMAHLRQVLVVPALIAACSVGALWQRSGPTSPLDSSRMRTWGRAAVTVLFCAWALTMLQWGWRTNVGRKHTAIARSKELGEPRADLLLLRRPRRVTSEIVRELRSLTHAGEPIFAAPYAPMLYFLADRPNPTRYDLVAPGHQAREDVQEAIISSLEEARVRVVVLRRRAWDGRPERRFPDYAPALARYVKERFRPHRRIGRWVVYVRRGRGSQSGQTPR